jgi:aerobic C4-dicarboxylate transport protein
MEALMKLWLQYALAGTAGILLGTIIQPDSLVYPYMFGIAEFGLRFGRFIIFPLFFFTLAISVCQLRRDRILLKMSLKLLLFSFCAAAIQVLLSTGLSLVLPINRIPIISETSGWQSPYPFRNIPEILPLQDILRKIIPINGFEIFNNTGDFLLPALVFAFFLGTQLFYDREEAEPVFNFFDSFGRMMYRMNSLFTKIFAVLLIPISCIMVVHLREIGDWSSYAGLLQIVLISTGILVFGIYPLAYFLVTRKKPYAQIRVFLPSLIASIFTGDHFMNAQVLLRVLKENGGLKRKTSGFTVPLLTMFSRAGTAMVISICLLTILRSYSSLELTAFQIFWVMGTSVIVSFLLFAQSYMGVYTALIISCGLYGRGLTEGYILILPVLPLLIIFAGILDTVNSAFIALAIGHDKDLRFPKDLTEYI